MIKTNFYRPQRSWAKVMFLQASVILLTRGVSASVHAGIPPWTRSPGARHPPDQHTPPGTRHPPEPDTPRADTPWDQTHPRTRPPGSRHPPDQTPPGADPPGTRHPFEQTPPWEAHSGIRSTRGQYASYWNAFLFI